MSAAIIPMPTLSPQRRLQLVTRQQTQILPRIQACAAAHAAHPETAQRKAPHRLRLVQAASELAWQAPTAIRAMQPEIAFYRKYTEGMLRRYLTMSFEKGRVPALLGRELFRGKVSSYQVHAFDDVVIFVTDMDNCMKLLDPASRYLLRRIAMEGYSQEETAALTGLGLRTVIRKYGEGLDKLTRILLDRGLLKVLDFQIDGDAANVAPQKMLSSPFAVETSVS